MTDNAHLPRPRGKPVTLTEIDQLALAEAAKAGITSPCQIAPDFSHYTMEMMGNDLMVVEARVSVLEQRLHWIMKTGLPSAGAHFGID